MVIWITGLSGSGKTTIGREVYTLIKEHAPNTVLLDGDEVRQILHIDSALDPYSLEARRQYGIYYSRICSWLDQQQIHVVCCTICSFPEIRQMNRDSFSTYFEVLIDVPIHTLIERNSKDLYRKALSGEQKNVVGIDLPYTPPDSPDLLLPNDNFSITPKQQALRIIDACGILQ